VLAELAELIATTLNASDPGKWGTYKVPGYVSAENCLDPEVVRQSSTKRELFGVNTILTVSIQCHQLRLS